jgi:glycosyltransferase involved in cell wall biosynthesis
MSTTVPSVSAPSADANEFELSIIMPCLNEAETLATCIGKALTYLRENGVAGEVVIADNGSTDGSQDIAVAAGARVVPVAARGYGAALMGGISAARGRFIVMGDADDSYDFLNLSPFLEKLREGYELVMGNRFRGGIAPGAMPPLHRFLGNPVLTAIGRIFFHSPVRDFHCGLRGFRRDSVLHLDLQTTGMEFASEMVVKATLLDLKITEVPTTLSPDGRSRPPHLRTWRDGWRHLRFLLLYSPRWLFLYPGLLLILAGVVASSALLPGPVTINGVGFDVNTLVYAALAIIVGFTAVVFAVLTKVFAINAGLLPEDRRFLRLFEHVTLETGLVIGGLLVVFGLAGALYSVHVWEIHGLGRLDPRQTIRIIVPSMLSIAIGSHIILSSFFLSVLGLRRKGWKA